MTHPRTHSEFKRSHWIPFSENGYCFILASVWHYLFRQT